MRCRACGRKIDNNSRFCTYCDCDNYPEMNQVKTKGEKTVYRQQPRTVNTKYAQSAPNTQKKTSASNQNNAAGCIIGIVIAVFFLIFFFAQFLAI